MHDEPCSTAAGSSRVGARVEFPRVCPGRRTVAVGHCGRFWRRRHSRRSRGCQEHRYRRDVRGRLERIGRVLHSRVSRSAATSVTVTLPGFKTAVVNDVRIVTGNDGERQGRRSRFGALTETVEVNSRAELVQSQSPQVSSTLVRRAAERNPAQLAQRALRACAAAGRPVRIGRRPARAPASTACRTTPSTSPSTASRPATCCSRPTGSSRWSRRASTRSRKSPSPARCPARGSGPGRCRSRSTTRSGSNRSTAASITTGAQPEFNSNYYFNKVNDLPKNEVIVHQYGFRQGGPIVHPRPLRRPRQGVLLLQLRAPPPAVERRPARARCCGPKRRPASSART